MRVAVIGAGPSGLVTLKYLSTAHQFFPIDQIEVKLFEGRGVIGGTFRHRVYEDAELVSSKYLTAFSDFRLPKDAPDFLTPERYCQYLEDYIEEYELLRHIHLNTKVISVTRTNKGGNHVLTIQNPDGDVSEWVCDAIAICSGLHEVPDCPSIDGISNVQTILHSSQVKARTQFGRDTTVMVLGAGETGMDMAHLAVTSPTHTVVLCHRDGFFCGPKIISEPHFLGGRFRIPSGRRKPVDCAPASLFDTAYVPPVLQTSPFLWEYYDKWIKFSQRLISGTPLGPDQWIGHPSTDRHHVDSVFFCKSDRALPYISAQYRSKSFLNRFRAWCINVPIKDTGGRIIELATWPQRIEHDGTVIFTPSDRAEYHRMKKMVIKPDVVVFATGYKRDFPFLDETYGGPRDADVRGIYYHHDPTISFIGFVRPGIGAIPPLAEMQAQLWVYRLLQAQNPAMKPFNQGCFWDHTVAPYEMDWALHSRGSYNLFTRKGGVEQESYIYQLALDLGSAPTISYMWGKGFKIFYAWAMGPNFNTKFRLIGPWRWEAGAESIMEDELYEVVGRSGGLFFLTTYTLVPMVVFGTVSLFIHLLDWIRFVYSCI